MVKQNNIILNLWFAFVMFYVCFKHFFVNDTFLYLIMDILLLLIILTGSFCAIKIQRENWWILYAVLVLDMFFSVLYAVDFSGALKFTILYLNFLIIAVLFTHLADWQTTFYRWLKIGCLFHLGYTYFSVFFTKKALEISQYFLTKEAQTMTKSWAKDYRYAGISGQTGTNAFFFVLLIGMFTAELYSKTKYKMLIGILLISSWIGLLLTGKKGLLIAALAATLVGCWASADRPNKGKTLIKIIILACVFLTVFLTFNKQIYQLFDRSVLSRVRIINGMLPVIMEKPILGNGVNSAANFTYKGHLGHNIYLQMWLEQGILGLVILLSAFLLTLYSTYIKLKKDLSLGVSRVSSAFSLFMQIFVIVYGCVGNPIYDYNIVITYFLVIAAGFANDFSPILQRLSQSEKKKKGLGKKYAVS